MTSPVATVGLLYDSVDLQRSDLGIFCRIVKGLNETPTVRGTDTIIPSAAGRMEGLRVNDVLAIELECTVQADASETTADGQMASFRANQRTLRTLFAPDRGRAELIASLEDGTIVSISALPLNIIGPESVTSMISKTSVALEGYDDWAEVLGS